MPKLAAMAQWMRGLKSALRLGLQRIPSVRRVLHSIHDAVSVGAAVGADDAFAVMNPRTCP
jgi:hypothetical protein